MLGTIVLVFVVVSVADLARIVYTLTRKQKIEKTNEVIISESFEFDDGE
jgi:hypothetical protein